jgi:hypothetical protein
MDIFSIIRNYCFTVHSLKYGGCEISFRCDLIACWYVDLANNNAIHIGTSRMGNARHKWLMNLGPNNLGELRDFLLVNE